MAILRTRVMLATAVAGMVQDPRIGVTSLIDNQNGPKLLGQYASVSYPSSTAIGRDEQRLRNQDAADGTDLIETSMGFRQLMFSIVILREDAVDAAERIRLSVRKHWARAHMLERGMALSHVGPTRDITISLDAEREQRGQFDVFYNTVQSLEDVLHSIERVDIQGQFESRFVNHRQESIIRRAN